MNIETPVIEIDHLCARMGRRTRVNGLSLRVGAGKWLRVLRAQRRGEDHDDQVAC